LSGFWKKNRDGSDLSQGIVPFLEWATGKDFLFNQADFTNRLQQLLTEIQKRSLSEQVLLLSWDIQRNECKVLGISPTGDKPIIPQRAQIPLIQKAAEKKRILKYEDLMEDEHLRGSFRYIPFDTLVLCPLNINQHTVDVLLIVNYLPGSSASRILDFISFISSVLALAIQNSRLYAKLTQKDDELKKWVGHVEKRIEEGTKKMLEKEFRYHVLFEGSNDGILVHDASGKLMETNRTACRLLGYDKGALLKKQWNDLVVPDYRQDQAAFFKRVLARVRATLFETMLRKKDGSTFHAELSSHRVRFNGKEAIQTFIRDISLRRALEESLRESKEKYRMLVESSLVGVFIIHNGTILFVNTTFEGLAEYEKNELLEKDFFELVAPEDRDLVKEREIHREQGSDEPDHYEVRFIKKTGEKFWAELRAGRVMLDGKAAVIGNVIDISQRRYLEAQLLEKQKMESIGTLAGGIAHDFNNLLGGILGYASLLLTDMSEDHPYFDDINAIAETTKRAADLTNRLLGFARGGKYQIASIDMNDMVGEIVDVLSIPESTSISLKTRLKDDLWPVLGDSRQIQQAVLNVCLNAVEAMPGGGRLVISTSNTTLDESAAQEQLGISAGEYVCISVSDTGIGMDEKTKSRMFEPFFTTKPTGAGTGFGLAMVYGIITNHDGAIQVTSEAGKGTEVVIYLPRYVEARVSEVEAGVPVPEGGNKVLLVDDEYVIRQVASRMLERGGYDVLLASNGKEALTIYEKNRDAIGVVLLDLIMPGMGGRETHRRLKEIDPDVKIVYTSGYGLQDRPELRQLRDIPFIQKPFQTEVLVQTIGRLLGVKTVGK